VIRKEEALRKRELLLLFCKPHRFLQQSLPQEEEEGKGQKGGNCSSLFPQPFFCRPLLVTLTNKL
jgi:hypothetical protein